MKINDITTGETYYHYKNKKAYRVIDRCLLQEEGEWVHAVIYGVRDDEMQKFVRSEYDFASKFKTALEYKARLSLEKPEPTVNG